MRAFPYKKVDAFTSQTSMGNPAAFLTLRDAALSPEEMLRVGREHAGFVSEVVFCSPSSTANVKLTYYSSECEVAFCGHGTIATMYELIRCDDALRRLPEVTLETNRKGVLTVENALDDEDCVYITAPQARFLPLPCSLDEAALALGAARADPLPMDFIDAGLRTLIVPVRTPGEEVALWPDEAALRRFCEGHGIDIILPFCMEAGSGAIAHTRVFAPRFGYLEDPATGSGNSAFGYYLLRQGLWDGRAARIEQGGERMAFNEVKLKSRDGQVLFGGRASLRIEGTYFLD